MSGKCRPSLRKKTLENVMRSNLSNTDKVCIAEVFKRYEIGIVEVVRCKDCVYFKTDTDYCKEHKKGYCEWDKTIKSRNHFCSYGEKALKERENR